MPENRPLDLVSLCGSLRQGSLNAAIQRSLPELAPAGVTITALPGIGEMPLYNADVQAQGFPKPVIDMADAIRKADGVVICSPEYNYSVPGVLKNAIDWISRVPSQPFAGKPVLIQSASQGVLGGARMQYHLRQILVFVEALVFNRPEVMVSQAQTKVDQELKLTDPATRDFIKTQLAAFETFVRRVG
ncbi:MAG TPA: NADPH-dependent FMN reductase [Dongiaceae bacterium]|jgi:chromate reductase|nr:NADPH-dependent FMN reductase [Dongiaceae bacterium]